MSLVQPLINKLTSDYNLYIAKWGVQVFPNGAPFCIQLFIHSNYVVWHKEPAYTFRQRILD